MKKIEMIETICALSSPEAKKLTKKSGLTIEINVSDSLETLRISLLQNDHDKVKVIDFTFYNQKKEVCSFFLFGANHSLLQDKSKKFIEKFFEGHDQNYLTHQQGKLQMTKNQFVKLFS